jgi:RNA polymerase sigma factor (sigma-70 family)
MIVRLSIVDRPTIEASPSTTYLGTNTETIGPLIPPFCSCSRLTNLKNSRTAINMLFSNSAVRRKRNRMMEWSPRVLSMTSWAWEVIWFAVVLSSVEGFTMVPTSLGPSRTSLHHASASPLQASSSFTTSGFNRKSRQRRLSSEEQQELFRHVMEVRRIRNVEQEVPSLDADLSSSDLARLTGYGKRVGEMEDAIQRGEEARERLITTNMGLVHYCVNDILKSRAKLRYITIDDLVQEGAIGLARAVDKYNPLFYSPDKNASPPKFSTYAVYWIRAAVLRCIAERDDVMRVPEHVSAAVRKISQAEQSLGWRTFGEEEQDDALGERVTSLDDSTSVVWSKSDSRTQQDILAKTTGLSDRMLQNAMMVRNRRQRHATSVLSYESWMQLGQHYETDLQQQALPPDPSSSMEHIHQTLSRFLRPKEMEALSWRYGLNAANPLAKRDYLAQAEVELFGEDISPTTKGKWGEAMSFTEVGRHMQVSAEYGRRLCHQALDKLRRAVADGMLEPALLV